MNMRKWFLAGAVLFSLGFWRSGFISPDRQSDVLGAFSQSRVTFKTPLPLITLPPSPTPTSTPSPTITPSPIPTEVPLSTATPTETPTPIPTISYTSSDMDRWFEDYSRQYSVDRMRLFSIAVCESFLRPEAVNGPYGGLFQFTASTWQVTRQQMNLDPDPNLRFSPEEAIKTAAYKLSVAGNAAWPNCGR